MGDIMKKILGAIMGRILTKVLSVIVAIGIGVGVRLMTHEDGVKGGLASMQELGESLPDSISDTLSMAPDEDRPVRCRVGEEERFLRGLDCQQQGGYVVGDGSDGGYSTVSAEEQRAAVAPTVTRRDARPEAQGEAGKKAPGAH